MQNLKLDVKKLNIPSASLKDDGLGVETLLFFSGILGSGTDHGQNDWSSQQTRKQICKARQDEEIVGQCRSGK